jgi:choline-glycine betaine transporter
MRATYKALCHTIAGLVVVQAAAIAFAMFGVLHFVDGGDSLNKSIAEDRSGFDGAAGWMVHSFGAILISVIAIVLLILSLFAKIPGGTKWAGILFLVVLLQWVLAIVAFGAPVVGALHAINAFAIAGVAEAAAKQAGAVAPGAPTAEAAAVS